VGVSVVLKVHEDWETRDAGFFCPACGVAHWIPTAGSRGWTWNGSKERPTFAPSLLVLPRGRREAPDTPRCHMFVRDGEIEYLSDSTHQFAGKTVPMVPVEDWRRP
jgi:hypothetical protein